MGRCWTATWALAVVAGCVAPIAAAEAERPGGPGSPGARPQDDLTARPTEAGIRMTPGLARAIARSVAKADLVGRYGLDESKLDEAAESMARRIMAACHELDGPGQELLERFIEEQVRNEAEGGGGDIAQRFGRELGQRVVPMIPTIRNMVRGITRDVRPMLPMKSQLKMAADLALLETGFNGFEENMQRWSRGEIRAFENPFEDHSRQSKLDERGRSQALKSARQSAEQAVGQGTWSRWKRYVEEAAKFYNFDSSQVATAQSILQEYLERVQTSLRDETWRQRVYDNRLWLRMMWTLPGGWQNPLRAYLEGEYVEMVDPIMVLERQFKERIDDIPTLVQREAAAQHMERILAEKGLGLEEPLPQSQASEGGTRP